MSMVNNKIYYGCLETTVDVGKCIVREGNYTQCNLPNKCHPAQMGKVRVTCRKYDEPECNLFDVFVPAIKPFFYPV